LLMAAFLQPFTQRTVGTGSSVWTVPYNHIIMLFPGLQSVRPLSEMLHADGD
jgi:hypothetical protein